MTNLILEHTQIQTTALPKNWQLCAVGDVVDAIQPGFASGRHNSDGVGVPHLRPMNINPTGRIDLNDLRFVAPDNPLRLQRNDILFNNTNSPAWVGKTAVVDTEEDLAFSNHMTRLRPSAAVHPTFLAKQLHYLCSSGYFRHQCKKHVNQASISRTFLKESTPFVLPPIREQQRIVAKIASLQERSSRARAALAEVGPLLEQFRRSVLSAAFSGRLTADWRAANPDIEPASELLHRIRTERCQRWEQAELAKYEAKGKKPPKNWQEKYQEPSSPDNNQLPKLPPTWDWARLDALAPQDVPIVYGIILPGPHIPDGVPFVRPVDIRDGTVDVAALPRTTTEIAGKYQRAALRAGDLVFSIVGTIGKSLIVQDELDGANITQSSVRIRPLQPLTAEMLLQALQSPTLTNQMEHLQFGNAVQRLNVEHMRSLAIPVPPLGEWQEITKRVKQGYQLVQAMIDLCSSAASDLSQLDQSILAKAFRGELVPQDPNDEPAAELLARIAAAREAAASSSKTSKRARKPAARKAANA